MNFKRFYSEPELDTFGFKHIGRNTRIARNTFIDDPSTISIGSNTLINEFCTLTGEIEIGDWTNIAHYVHLSGKDGIRIGNYCGVGARSTLYTEHDDHNRNALFTPCLDEFRNPEVGPIIIEDHVLIGFCSFVLPNTLIALGNTFGEYSFIKGYYNTTWGLYYNPEIVPKVKNILNNASKVHYLVRKQRKETEPLKITAEIGSCWRGDFGTLALLLDCCKEARVDYVKFQSFRADQTTHPEKVINAVTADNVAEINEICNTYKIPWYCTPCYPEAIDFLNPFVDKWKIRYKDQHNPKIFNTCYETGKQIILSSSDTIRPSDIICLYVTPKYPTPKEEVDVSLMEQFDGWSCHTPDISFVVDAVKKTKIRYLEVHIKPDNDEDLVDRATAFDVFQLQELCSKLRKMEQERWNTTQE